LLQNKTRQFHIGPRDGRRWHHRCDVILFWRVLAVFFIVLGVVGIVLPILPTVPFLLLATWAASRGWPELEQRILSHAVYGPMVVRWRERRAVPRRAKWFATIGMAGSSTLLWLSPAPGWLQVTVPAVMFAVGVWIWLRPDE
jgi:uncharacterized membrane protein YbaN (DUF454 family)